MDDPAEDDELVDDPHDETLVALNVHASFGLAAASCIASIIMIIAYYCQSSRAPRLLLWLFWSNFFWFAGLVPLLTFDVLNFHDPSHDQHAKLGGSCTGVAAISFFFQTFSMLWPSVICFDLWQNTRDPRWRLDSPQRVEYAYLLAVTAVSALAPISILKSPNKKYCYFDEYSPSQSAYNVVLELALPLSVFAFNLVALVVVRRSLAREMPFSVRTRRRRQMYNYVFVWMFCWGVYVGNALVFELYGDANSSSKLKMLFLARNLTLYSTGVLDLVVFGLQNAWLKRSLRMACDRCRLTDLCCMEDVQASYLKNPTDKSVSFDPSLPDVNSEVFSNVYEDGTQKPTSKEYVTRRLSKPDKYLLYRNRPDLDSNRPLEDINAEYDREERFLWAQQSRQQEEFAFNPEDFHHHLGSISPCGGGGGGCAAVAASSSSASGGVYFQSQNQNPPRERTYSVPTASDSAAAAAAAANGGGGGGDGLLGGGGPSTSSSSSSSTPHQAHQQQLSGASCGGGPEDAPPALAAAAAAAAAEEKEAGERGAVVVGGDLKSAGDCLTEPLLGHCGGGGGGGASGDGAGTGGDFPADGSRDGGARCGTGGRADCRSSGGGGGASEPTSATEPPCAIRSGQGSGSYAGFVAASLPAAAAGTGGSSSVSGGSVGGGGGGGGGGHEDSMGSGSGGGGVCGGAERPKSVDDLRTMEDVLRAAEMEAQEFGISPVAAEKRMSHGDVSRGGGSGGGLIGMFSPLLGASGEDGGGGGGGGEKLEDGRLSKKGTLNLTGDSVGDYQ